MIILDRPYVSDFLASTLQRLRTPVLRNGVSEATAEDYDLSLIDIELEALRYLDPYELPKPFVVKPAVGFFSMAVLLKD